jgi:hypothetical protein
MANFESTGLPFHPYVSITVATLTRLYMKKFFPFRVAHNTVLFLWYKQQASYPDPQSE